MAKVGKSVVAPRLRFPEFSGIPGWEEKPLEALLSPIVREREKPAEPYTGLGIRSHGKGTFLKPRQAPEKNAMEVLYEVRADDLIVNITFAWEGAIAIAQTTDNGALVSHRFPTYEFKKESALPDFFRYAILDKQLIYQLGVISPGGAGRNRVLNKRDFLKLTRLVPRTAEQQKIAGCLTSLDEVIAAQARKVETLKAYRRGLIQQLFPREGETCPRLRFSEFRNAPEWRDTNLNALGELISGLTYSPDDVRDSGLLVLRSSNVQNAEIVLDDNVYVTPSIKGASLARPNDILICVRNGSKALIGKCALIPVGIPPCTHGAFMTVFRAHGPQFVFQLMQSASFQKQVAADLGATINSINGRQLLKYRFFIPEPDEQERIGEFLLSLSNRIAAESRQLAILKAHKQGLMQQLLPAPTKNPFSPALFPNEAK